MAPGPGSSLWLKILFRAVFPALLIILMVAWLSGWFETDLVRSGKVEVTVRKAPPGIGLEVAATTEPVIWEAVGTVAADSQATIAARVTAQIVEMRVGAGDRVSKGDLLVRLDDRQIRARLSQAREAVRRARATMETARSDFERDRKLVEKQVIPPAEFDQTRMRLQTSEAEMARLEDAVREAEVILSDCEIHSPYQGVVIDHLLDVGDLAVPGRPLLSLYLEGRLRLEASVAEAYTPLVHVGQTLGVRIDALDRRFAGRVSEIIPVADPATRTTLARVDLPRDADLRPGMFGRLEIPVGEVSRLLIPGRALIRLGQLAMVDVVEGGLLKRRSVQLGETRGDRVEILSGLRAGEVVAVPQEPVRAKPRTGSQEGEKP